MHYKLSRSLIIKIHLSFPQLKKKIAELESAAMADKPWQLMGEVTATDRPENSLLQEDLDFEFATKLRMYMCICVLDITTDLVWQMLISFKFTTDRSHMQILALGWNI